MLIPVGILRSGGIVFCPILQTRKPFMDNQPV